MDEGPLRAARRRGATDLRPRRHRDAIDWRAGLARRAEYTFDSGCRKCHRALADARGNQPAFVAHRPYFLGEIERKCVGCHPHVGHRALAAALPPAGLPPATDAGAEP